MSYPNNPYPQGNQQVIFAPGYAPAPPKGMSITSMVLGLVSLFLGWSFLVPILGLIFGILGAKKEPAGRGMAVAGIIINSIILAGWVAVICLLVALGTFATIGAAASQS